MHIHDKKVEQINGILDISCIQMEFWTTIATMGRVANKRGGSSSSSGVSSSLPPAHHQLLIDDESPAFTSLKGYDHTASQDDVVCYSSDSEEDDDDDDVMDACSSRQKGIRVKQQGGGSWLLDLARLNQHDNNNAKRPLLLLPK